MRKRQRTPETEVVVTVEDDGRQVDFDRVISYSQSVSEEPVRELESKLRPSFEKLAKRPANQAQANIFMSPALEQTQA